MIVKVFYFTHTGNYRKINEDALLIHDTIIQTKQMKTFKYCVVEDERPIFAVADGMGGHDKGEVASTSVLDSILKNKLKIQTQKKLHQEIIQAKNSLNQKAISMNTPGMGTTLCGIFFTEKKAMIYSVGDSRAYSISTSKIERLTEDHTEVFELFKNNIISEEELRLHKRKNILTSAIVGDLSDRKPKIFEREIPVTIGSSFLLCTDGLWEGIPQATFDQFVQKDFKEESICTQMIQFSLKYSGLDNISFILLKVIDL